MSIQNPIFEMILDEDEIQEFALNNFGRCLTDVELNRIKEYSWDCEKVFWARGEVIDDLIEFATDESDGQWENADKEYLESL